MEEPAGSSNEPLIQPPITSHFIRDEVHTAEIYWTLDCINNHSSYNSSIGKSSLFRLMFPDSAIAKQFSCSASTMAYLAAFGIAPCLSSRLLAKLKTCDEYVLMFDESLNKPLQEKQLDILVRFWNSDTISSRYFDSYFLGHARSEDLYEPIRSCCDKIGVQRILQLSMDGPNVNWKLFRNVSNDIEEETNKQMLNIGSCGLYIMHNANKSGVNSCTWDVENILCSLHRLFKDTPARQEDFVQITVSTEFPLKYCPNRWLENAPVIDRVIKIWPNVQKYVAAVEAKKTPKPQTISFASVQQASKDLLFISKLNICLLIAKVCQEFLTKYQPDAPMIPYLSNDLFKLTKQLLERFIKTDVMKQITTPIKLFKNNFHKEFPETKYHKDASEVNVGFIGEQQLRNLNVHKKVSDLALLNIKRETKGFYIAIVKKLLEKSPLNYKLVRSTEWLNPLKIKEDRNVPVDQLTKCLEVLCNTRRIKADKCDEVISEFKSFMDEKKRGYCRV